MHKFKRYFTDGEYGQIHFRMLTPDQPSKRPLVCLHMFPQSSRSYVNFLNSIGDERIVIAPDFPGHGESDAPEEPIDASDYARSSWQVIDQLSLLDSHGSVDLFGIHAGAKLATEVAYQRKSDVNRIIISSAAILYPEEMAALKQAFAPIPLDQEGSRFNRLWQLFVRNRGPAQSYEMIATNFAELLRGGEKYEWGHDAVYDFNTRFPDVLKSLPHRISLLNPNDDLYEKTFRTEQYLQNGELIDCPQWGSGFLEGNAAELAQTVRQLLEQEQ